MDQAVYLDGLLSTSVSARPEVTRRVGEAKGCFKALQKCWSHANISRASKTEIYTACVLSKLLYSLESLWLLQADLCRLDGFHVKCLRQIFSIPSSFISRIPNHEVLKVAGQRPLSSIIHERQVRLYKEIVLLPEQHILRQLTCEPGSSRPRRWSVKRRAGRPKQQWAACVYAIAQS